MPGDFPTRERERAELGVALDTRNYEALLSNLAAQRVPRRASMPVAPPPPAYQSSYEGVEDRTAVGVPIQTRNYVAMINGASPPLSVSVARAAEEAVAAEDVEDADAVLGLPISTGNYVAYIAGKEQTNAGAGGYGKLAPSPGSRASAPSLPLPPTRKKHDRDSFATANSSPESRPSCFDNGRRSSAAALYNAGWVLIEAGGAFKGWKRYYAVLSGIEFKYSKGMGQPPKGFGNIRAARRWNALQCGILLEFMDGTQLQIRSENEADYENWMEMIEKAIDRNQQTNSQSKTSYTLTASQQHEGYLFKLEKNKVWKRSYFTVRIDGYIECRDRENGSVDRRSSGYIKAVSFADNHANGLAIEVEGGESVVCYADTYDEQMMWYAAIASAASANTKATPQPASTIKSTYVHTAITNHAGWLYRQSGLFKSWKRVYFTLHGLEIAYAKDTNSEVMVCDVAQSVEDWDGHTNGLLIRLRSGRSWKVHADSYESAKRWRSVISGACRYGDTFNMKKYLASRKRKKLPPVFGGWLTKVDKNTKLRQFYVIDGSTLGYANDIDNELQRLGTVVDVGASRDLDCGIVISLSNGMKLKAACDSLQSSRMWYDCLNASIS